MLSPRAMLAEHEIDTSNRLFAVIPRFRRDDDSSSSGLLNIVTEHTSSGVS